MIKHVIINSLKQFDNKNMKRPNNTKFVAKVQLRVEKMENKLEVGINPIKEHKQSQPTQTRLWKSQLKIEGQLDASIYIDWTWKKIRCKH